MTIKSIKRLNVFSHFGRLNLNLKNFNAKLTVKGRPRIVGLMLHLSHLFLVRLRKSDIAGIVIMISRIIYLYKQNGPKGTVLYLKGSAVLLQQALGQYTISDTSKVGKMRIGRRGGLPSILPPQFRMAIRQDNFAKIKLVLTILNIFRVIEFRGTPALSTIVQGFKGPDVDTIYVDAKGQARLVKSLNGVVVSLVPFIVPFINVIGAPGLFTREHLAKKAKMFTIWKASPGMAKADLLGGISNYSTHPINLVLSFRALYKETSVFESLIFLANRFGSHRLTNLLKLGQELGIQNGVTKNVIGKLHAKEEAAGKVRLFAIVDAWTQWCLRPLHSSIFNLLRRIPQDGTFDQLAPLSKIDGSKGLWSLDLTAATDRLPLLLQVRVLQCLLGDSAAADHWANLLVGRTYKFYQLGYSKYHGDYRYAIGQPMGALSSWAMLALVHHFLVQVSAWKAGTVKVGVWYRNYALLGDDLVLGDKAVAESYLQLLVELGMEVNIYKSILSPAGTALEFAKRTIYKGQDVSPIALKDIASAQLLLPAFVQFMRTHKLSISSLLRAFGYGWRTLSWLNKPLGKLSAQVRNVLLAVNIPTDVETADKFFTLGTPKFSRYVPNLHSVGLKFIQVELSGARLKLETLFERIKAFRFGPPFLFEEMAQFWASDLLTVETGLISDRLFDVEVDITDSKSPSLIKRKAKLLEQKAELVSKSTNLKIKQNYVTFFEEVWINFINHTLSDYQYSIHNILRVYDDWTQPFNIIKIGQKISHTEFLELYITYVNFLKEYSRLGTHIFDFSKPEGSEGLSKSANAVTPAQIRFYRKWAGVLQGSFDVNQLTLEFKKSRPPVLVIPRDESTDPTREE